MGCPFEQSKHIPAHSTLFLDIVIVVVHTFILSIAMKCKPYHAATVERCAASDVVNLDL